MRRIQPGRIQEDDDGVDGSSIGGDVLFVSLPSPPSSLSSVLPAQRSAERRGRLGSREVSGKFGTNGNGPVKFELHRIIGRSKKFVVSAMVPQVQPSCRRKCGHNYPAAVDVGGGFGHWRRVD